MTLRVRLRIKGRVQGVGFRLAAAELARSHGLTGIIFNDTDGSVLVEVEGSEPAISEFVAWSRRGPQGAVVTSVDEETIPAQGDKSFEITRAPYQAEID
jgi:acylphosphatase